jgi:hypothetical protein
MSEQAKDREWRTGGNRVEAGPLAYSPPPVLPRLGAHASDVARSLIRDLSDWSWPAQPAI